MGKLCAVICSLLLIFSQCLFALLLTLKGFVVGFLHHLQLLQSLILSLVLQRKLCLFALGQVEGLDLILISPLDVIKGFFLVRHVELGNLLLYVKESVLSLKDCGLGFFLALVLGLCFLELFKPYEFLGVCAVEFVALGDHVLDALSLVLGHFLRAFFVILNELVKLITHESERCKGLVECPLEVVNGFFGTTHAKLFKLRLIALGIGVH